MTGANIYHRKEAGEREVGLEEVLGDNVGLEGLEVPQAENMDIEKGVNHVVERKALVRSPH